MLVFIFSSRGPSWQSAKTDSALFVLAEIVSFRERETETARDSQINLLIIMLIITSSITVILELHTRKHALQLTIPDFK